MNTYKHKLQFVEGDLHNGGQMVCVAKQKYGEVLLALKADGSMWNIPISRIKLYTGDNAKDAFEVFESAYRLGQEITVRWNTIYQARISADIDFPKLIEDCLEWSYETFKKDRVAIRKIHHLKKEVGELLDALEYQEKQEPSSRLQYDDDILMEYADCLMLLTTSLVDKGFTWNDLQLKMAEKLEINKTREWGLPDENGVVEHKKGA